MQDTPTGKRRYNKGFDMERWERFAHQTPDGRFSHIFPSTLLVRVCGDGPIVKVLVEVMPEGSTEITHFGWWATKDASPFIIFPTVRHLDMCFPNGIKSEVKFGTGRVVPLKVCPL